MTHFETKKTDLETLITSRHVRIGKRVSRLEHEKEELQRIMHPRKRARVRKNIRLLEDDIQHDTVYILWVEDELKKLVRLEKINRTLTFMKVFHSKTTQSPVPYETRDLIIQLVIQKHGVM